jgi:hypothetical protein
MVIKKKKKTQTFAQKSDNKKKITEEGGAPKMPRICDLLL